MNVNNLREKLNSNNEDDKIFALHEILDENCCELIPDVIKLIKNEKSQIIRETSVDILKHLRIIN